MTSDTRALRRDDVVIVDERTWWPVLVLACGPRSFDIIEQSGGTTRYLHAHKRNVRLATASDFNHDLAYEASVRERLVRQAGNARDERRRGAGVRRGHVAPSR
jgi:hypothetical protein